MTPDRFRIILAALGWSWRDLAGRLGMDNATTVRQWSEGHTRIPPRVSDWLERVAAVAIAEPLPPGWEIRQ